MSFLAANNELSSYQAGISTEGNCSDIAELYLCLALMPPCSETVIRYPCESFCRLITDSCALEIAMGSNDIRCLFSGCERY